jgi:segregation and condensation protein B
VPKKNKSKFESDEVIQALLQTHTPSEPEETELLLSWAEETTLSDLAFETENDNPHKTPNDELANVELEGDEIDEEISASNISENDELASFESAEVIEVEELSNARMLSILESLLFASDRPISLEIVKQAFKGTSIKTADIKKGLDELAVQLAESHRGVSLDEVAGGYHLRTKLDNVDFLRRSVKKQQVFRLSGPALEVLSIVAYKQPVIKAEIDQIRGVESGHLMRALMDRGLIRFGARTELPGKPMSYETAKKFLELFGLRNLKELPSTAEMDQLIPEGIGETPVEEKQLSDLTGDLSLQIGSTYSDAEEELTKISSEIGGIETMTTFFEDEARRKKEEADHDRAQDIRDRLVLGENVESKDARWLEKHERSLHEKAAKSLEGTAEHVRADEPSNTIVTPSAEAGPFFEPEAN